MQTEHVSFTSSDRLTLPGLLYIPAQPTKRVVVWLHGMGDSGVFYSPKRITTLAAALTEQGIALLAFNNRGAHSSKLLYKDDPQLPKAEQRYQAGTNYELIADCVADIDGAADFLKMRDFNELYLAGHSTGANKICVYDALQPAKPFSKYVLAGPGDDVGLWYQSLGARKFGRALDYAQAAVKAGKPLKIMPKYSGLQPFSAQSAADILDPDGHYDTFPYYEARHGLLGRQPLFDKYARITKPMLVIAGEHDGAAATAGSAAAALDLLRDHTNPACRAASEFQLVSGADHSFHDAEAAFARQITDWLAA